MEPGNFYSLIKSYLADIGGGPQQIGRAGPYPGGSEADGLSQPGLSFLANLGSSVTL
jgi:hypothetical protein